MTVLEPRDVPLKSVGSPLAWMVGFSPVQQPADALGPAWPSAVVGDGCRYLSYSSASFRQAADPS